ncbi:MAG: hypothetical protein GY861_25205 [bacterium]|nr:hypothetical protein [bacterium]
MFHSIQPTVTSSISVNGVTVNQYSYTDVGDVTTLAENKLGSSKIDALEVVDSDVMATLGEDRVVIL